MNICQLRLYNEMSVLVDVVDFLQEPFVAPLQLRIPKATKRIQERGENLFRDGSDIAGSRYNNAVITMQPRLVLDCVADEALKRIEQIRYRLDRILEYSRNTGIAGFGPRVEFLEDTKGFNLVSEIIDGTFDIEQDWEWSQIEQGVITESSLSLTRKPFRQSPAIVLLTNYVPNPGFELTTESLPDNWSGSGSGLNGSLATNTTHQIEGQRCLQFTTQASAGEALISSATLGSFGTGTGILVYLESWIHVPAGADSITMQLYDVTSAAIRHSVTWSSADSPKNPTDKSVMRSHRDIWYDRTTQSEYSDAKRFIHKAITANVDPTHQYQVRFRVAAPGGAYTYYIDRVLLSPQSFNTNAVAALDTIDPVSSETASEKFIAGWISETKFYQTMAGDVDAIQNIIAHWKLDEASGTRADTYGSNNLADNNTVTQAAGKVGNAAQFTAANSEYLSIADNTDLSSGDIEIHFTAWVYLDTKAADRVILSKWGAAGQREYQLFYRQSDDRFVFQVSNDGTAVVEVIASTFGSPSTATWYLIHAYHSASLNIIRISVNNGSENSTAHTTGIFDSTSEFRLGARADGTGFMDGRIDSASVLKSSSFFIVSTSAIYNGGNGRDYPFTSYQLYNYLDIVDIPGDVPALCDLELWPRFGNFEDVRAGSSSLNTPWVFNNTFQNGTVQDYTASGGNRNSTSIGASYVSIGSAAPPATTINNRAFVAGKFRVLIRAKDTASSQGNLRMRYRVSTLQTLTPYDGPEIVAPGPGSTKWFIADLGTISVPFLYNDRILDVGSNFSISVLAKHTTGTDNVYVDYIMLVPIHDWYIVASRAGGFPVGTVMHINSFPDIPIICFVTQFSGSSGVPELRSHTPILFMDQASLPPFVANGKAQRITVSISSASDESLLSDKPEAALWYRSRWL